MVEGVVWRVVPRVVVVRERGRGRGRRRHGRGDRCPGDEDAGEAGSRDVARAVLLSVSRPNARVLWCCRDQRRAEAEGRAAEACTGLSSRLLRLMSR